MTLFLVMVSFRFQKSNDCFGKPLTYSNDFRGVANSLHSAKVFEHFDNLG